MSRIVNIVWRSLRWLYYRFFDFDLNKPSIFDDAFDKED